MSDSSDVLLPLVLAGAALAGFGLLRLLTPALERMPRWLAFAVLIAGVGVAVLGVALRPGREPDVALEPIASSEPQPVAEGPVDITGTVRDADDDPVAGAAVTLRVFDRTEQVDELEVTTGDDGTFGFTDLQAKPTTAFVASTIFEDATFSSGLLLPGPHGVEPADLVVAPPTDDGSVIGIDVDSTVLVGDEAGIQVVHILSLRNSSEDAFVGPLLLPLLPGASGMVPRRGLDRTKLSVDGDGLVSFAPVLPGTTDIVYEYGLPARNVDWQRTLAYPTQRLDVLVAGEVAVDVESLEPRGEVELAATGTTRTFRRHTATNLDTGETVALTASVGGLGAARIALITGGVVIAVLILGVPLVRRRRTSAASASAAQT